MQKSNVQKAIPVKNNDDESCYEEERENEIEEQDEMSKEEVDNRFSKALDTKLKDETGKRQYNRKFPTLTQMKSEYDVIKANWIEMKQGRGEPVEKYNKTFQAFKAAKKEEEITRKKRKYDRAYPPPKMMYEELQSMKSDLERFRVEKGQISGNKADACTSSSSTKYAQRETSGPQKQKKCSTKNFQDNDKDQNLTCTDFSAIKGKGKLKKQEASATQEKASTSKQLAKEAKTKEARKIDEITISSQANFQTSLPRTKQTLQHSPIEVYDLLLTSTDRLDEETSSCIEEEEQMSSTQEEEEVSVRSKDKFRQNLEDSEEISDNDNDLFTENLLDDNLIIFCNMDEMHDLEEGDDEDELW